MGRMQALVAALIGSVVFALAWQGQAEAVEIRVPVEVERPKPKPETPTTTKLADLGGNLAAIDLSDLFNSDAMTSEADRNDADLDEWKQSFAAEELPKAGKFAPKGVKAAFLFPGKAPKKPNNVACQAQRIPLALKARQLHVLATATDGDQQARLILDYADGQSQADLRVTDWCTPKAAFGEKVGVKCASRIAIGVGGATTRGKETRATHLWVVSVPLDATRELKAIVLPNNAKIHVFALTLAK